MGDIDECKRLKSSRVIAIFIIDCDLTTYVCFLAQDSLHHVNSMNVINLSSNHISLIVCFTQIIVNFSL